MSLNIDLPMQKNLRPKITVLGIGGAGGNAVNNMIELNLQGVEFMVANTDAQALESSKAGKHLQLGENITEGLGAGSSPDVGANAAEESIDEVLNAIAGSHMLFITAGMGGGTGTGAAPVIARAAKEKGILTVGVVTKPFHFEGSYRMEVASRGVEALYKAVDTLIVIPNQNLFHKATEQTTFAEAFRMVDNVLYSGVKSITDLMTMPGLINLDFADVRTIMGGMGKAMMGTGEASGERRALEAAEAAISNPLLDNASMRGASGVLINISGGLDMTLFEADEAAQRIKDELAQDANIIFGSTFDKTLDSQIRVSVVATGIDSDRIGETNPLKNKMFKSADLGAGRAEITSNKPHDNHMESGGFIPPKAVVPGELEDEDDIFKEQEQASLNDGQSEYEFSATPSEESEYKAHNYQESGTNPKHKMEDEYEVANEQYEDLYRKMAVGDSERRNDSYGSAQVQAEKNRHYNAASERNYGHKQYATGKGKIGKSINSLFNFFKEGDESEQYSERQNQYKPAASQSKNYNKAHASNVQSEEQFQNRKEEASDLTISDDILNVPTFLRKKNSDDQ